MIKKIENFLIHLPKSVIFSLAVLGILGMYQLDIMTGPELSFSIFYLVPIAFVTWYGDIKLGILSAFLGSAFWFLADSLTSPNYSHMAIPIWNAIVRLGFFLLFVTLFDRIEGSLTSERSISRVDPLTELLNSRGLYESAYKILQKLDGGKNPLTISYLDLDNFKAVNDQSGHDVGDQLLQAVARTLKKNLRRTDIPSRVGGDEFVLLLPDSDFETAQKIMGKVKNNLQEEMVENKWPVTFSIGVLTCEITPDSIKDMIRIVDQLMYEVKKNGKNGIVYYRFRPTLTPVNAGDNFIKSIYRKDKYSPVQKVH